MTSSCFGLLFEGMAWGEFDLASLEDVRGSLVSMDIVIPPSGAFFCDNRFPVEFYMRP